MSWNVVDGKWVNRLLTIEGLATDPFSPAAVEGAVLRYGLVVDPQFETESLRWTVGLPNYGDIQGRPESLTDLTQDLELNDLIDVNLTGPDVGDVIAWDGNRWSTVNAPPIDLSNGTLSQIGDVTELALFSGAVPVYNSETLEYEVQLLSYNSLVNAPNAVSQLTKDVGVSYWDNDAGYITATDGISSGSLDDVTITDPLEGQMLLYRSGFWVNEYGPPANISMSGIGELRDVTYLQPGSEPGILTVDNMGELRLDSPFSGSGYTQSLVYDIEYGLGITSFRDSDNSGSAVYVDRVRGVTLRSDVNIVRLSGSPGNESNRPELRFESGDSGADTPSGNYTSFKMPAYVPGQTENVVYYLPNKDGDVGDLLATDGSGNLSWITRSSNGSLGDLSDVDLVTIPPSGGEGLVYNATANVWIPGAVTSVDLSSQSIDALGDVDTVSSAPQDGQGLIYSSSTGLWSPGAVSSVDLSSESIDALSDVDTSSAGHIPTDGQVLTWHASMSHWMPMDSQGGEGGGGAVSDRVSESLDSVAGHITFVELGRSGVLCEFSAPQDCWVTLYPTAALRAADASRPFDTDPSPGSGVLSEAYINSGATVLASPGTVYYNNDTSALDAIYASVRSSEGVLLDGATVEISAYPGVTGPSAARFSKQELKAVVAASSDFADFQTRIAAL